MYGIKHVNRFGLTIGLVVALFAADASAQNYTKRRRTRSYVPTNHTFGHVSLSNYDGDEQNLFSLILESTTLGDDFGQAFGGGRSNRLGLIVQSFQSNDRDRAVSLWGEFVDNLADYDRPVDLDRVALYVARESCANGSEAALFYGRQLAYIRDAMDLLADYIDSVARQRSYLERRNQLTRDAAAQMDRALIRARADWDILAVREGLAESEFRNALGTDRRYDRRAAEVLSVLYDEANRRVRRLGDDHRCDRNCRYHAWDGSRYVYLRDHRHGDNCGHALVGGRWVIPRSRSGPAPHVCDRNCNNHYYDGSRLVILKDHRHGPDCGHRWDGTHWVAAARFRRPSGAIPSGHRCTADCLDHYYDGSQVVVLKGHRHDRGCGHAFNGTHWIDIKRKSRRP